MTPQKVFLGLAAAFVVAVALAAAQQFMSAPATPSPDSDAPPKELIKVKHTTPIGAVAEVRSRVIKKYDIDKKHGLDIEFTPLNPGDIERVLFTGEVPVSVISALAAGTANLQGVPVKIIGPAQHMTYYIAVPKDSPIQTLDDLKGKKFGILPKITAAYTSVAVVLRSAGIDPETDLQLAFGTIPEVVNLLKGGEVDAAILAPPLAAPLLVPDANFRTIAKLEDLWKQNEDGLPLPFVVTAAHEDWVADNKETARRLVAVDLEASKFMQENPSVISNLTEYLEEKQLTSPAVKEWLEENVPPLLFETWGSREVEGLRRLFERAKEYGIIPPATPSLETMLIEPSALGL